MATLTSTPSRGEVRFRIRGKEHRVTVGETYDPSTTLNAYLRDTLNLTGTKRMCYEGGCGVCIVAATREHPVTKETVTFTINSCLVSLFSIDGWDITTIEDVSTENHDQPAVPVYHEAQEALVQFNGTQCGFCSPGMVMSMYTLLQQDEDVTMSTIENSFGGNICRCTGYRPILAAFKSLASDADRALIGNYPDIEDVVPCKNKKDGKCKKDCRNDCRAQQKVSFRLTYSDGEWFKVYTIAEIVEVFQTYPESSYMLVSGNTAQGVYRAIANGDLYIDVTNVEELLTSNLDGDTLELGGNMSLTEVMALFYEIGGSNESFSYLTKMADHIDLIGTVPVRNIGSLAGNLTIKHEYPAFPSDIFLILETVGATITIVDTNLTETTVSVSEYLDVDMTQKIITKITLKALDDTYKYKSYKIMPRAQNAHALINAGFLLQLDSDNLVVSARIVYGCITSTFIHATNTENYLIGKNIFDNSVLQEAMATLDSELDPDYVQPDPSPDFRKKLAISLFFKYILYIADPDVLDPRNISGAEILTRPISNGTQDYETQESLYPLTQPIPKIEAYAQVSGRAEYIMDMPDRPGQLYGALVLASAKAYSVIASIDTTEALALSGVVAFYGADDIPGVNSFLAYYPTPEELFCSGTVKYYNQPIGISVADNQTAAREGAGLVNITYTSSETQALYTVRQVLEADDQTRLTIGDVVNPERTGSDVQHVITGSYSSGMQYHYHMENQCCSVVPVEDGLDVFPATQWMDLIQSAIAENLNMDANKINVRVRRLGGAYGAKISRNGIVTCAAALAAYKLQKPVKMSLTLGNNIHVVGKRAPVTADYEMGLNDEGIVQYLTTTIYIDYGYGGGSEDMLTLLLELVKNGYVYDTFKITPYAVKTDMHTNTYCRAPGSTEGLGLIETIFEHASYALNMDPLTLRMANMDSEKFPQLIQYCEDLIEWADIDARKAEIEVFNQENRWRKRGLAVVPMAYPYEIYGNYYCLVSIYHSDGSVSISHGGVEMGQGINTKVAQVCAYTFGISVDKVSVKPSDNLVSPNVLSTGGSVTSESVVFAFLKAAEILNERMAPVRESLTDPTWLEVVQECYNQDINLNASYKFSTSEIEAYIIYAVLATEVEVDILTGQYMLTRVDLLEDTGDSMNPLIDIGQVEGAFVMGQGLWTTEEIVISDEGQILTNRTWTYKPPGAKDIPIDFRVKFPANNPNPVGVLYSKATAEPPLCTTICIPLAIRRAVASARGETGDDVEKWYSVEGPSTVENTFLNCLHDYTQYTL